jgi:ElaB/YqjD/DUF883 family membrane-anchored ribosome-binding protein
MAEGGDNLSSLEQPWQRSAEEIRQDIATKRDSISQTVDRLGENLQRKLDWREQVAQHPYMALGAAAAVGVLISGAFKHRPTPRERMMDAVAETIEDFTDDVRHSVTRLFLKSAGPSFLRSAIAGVLTKAVVQAFKSTKSGSDTRREQPDPAAE